MLCPWKKTMLIRSIGGTTLSVYFEKCGGSEDEVFRRAYAELLKITVTVFPLDRKFMENLPSNQQNQMVDLHPRQNGIGAAKYPHKRGIQPLEPALGQPSLRLFAV
jgi:hypothetical protein